MLKADLLFGILKQMKGFSLLLQLAHQMMTIPPFLRVSLATCEILIVTDDIVLGGDFNLVLDLEKDKTVVLPKRIPKQLM